MNREGAVVEVAHEANRLLLDDRLRRGQFAAVGRLGLREHFERYDRLRGARGADHEVGPHELRPAAR